MTVLARFYRSVALTAVSLAAAGAASAQTWDLDLCTPGSKSAAVYSGCGATGGTNNNAGGITVDVRAYTSVGGAALTSASINNGGSYIGVLSGTENGSGSPNHAIDNVTSIAAPTGGVGNSLELVHLQFTKAVDLSQVVANWANDTGGDADFRVYRWNNSGSVTTGTITGITPSALPTTVGSAAIGWQLVTNSDFYGALAQNISDGNYFSSNWLISTLVGGNNDAFKLGTVTATAVCGAANQTGGAGTTGLCTPTTNNNAPEPATMAMVLLAAVGVTATRRRRSAR